MAYASGTNTGSTDPVSDFVGEIETLLTAHAAWTFVEEVIDGSWTYRIWRNSGLQNDWGEDFYIALMWTSTTLLYSVPFEEWDAVNKKGIRGTPRPENTRTPEATYGSYYGDTGYDLDNNNAFYYTSGRMDFSTVSYDWWVVVTKNGLFYMTSEWLFPVYLGLFESFHPTNPREFPLWLVPLGDNDIDRAGTVSRMPEWSGSRSDCFATYAHISSATQWTIMDGTIPDGELLHGGEALGSRFCVYMSNPNDGAVRGLAYDVLLFSTDSAVSKGDTITVDGSTYWNGYGSIWIHRDAA